MAKDPVCPIYYNDLLGATREWTDEEFGAYVRLLLHQWDKGYVPNPCQTYANGLPTNMPTVCQPDFQRLARIAATVEKNWGVLAPKFREVAEGLQNENMEEIRLRRLKHKLKQSDNAQKRYQTPSQTPSQTPAKNMPLEYENEIEKEKRTLSFEGKGNFSFDKSLPLPSHTLEAAEMNQFTHTKKRNTEFVKDQWKIFLVERLADPDHLYHYRTIKDLTKYFLNFLRDKFPSNGANTNKRNNQQDAISRETLTSEGGAGKIPTH